MSLVFDALLLGLFAFFVIRGYIKGFLKTVLGFGRLILSVILTLIFGSAFADWLDAAFVNPPVYRTVHTKILEIAESAESNVASFLTDVSETFGNLFDPASLQSGETVDGMVERVSRSISGAVSMAISAVIGYILLFAIAFALLTVAIFVVDKLVKLPVIHGCDKVLGICLGAVSGFVAALMLSTVLYAVVYATGDMDALEDSVVFKFVHGINFFAFKP